MIIKLDHISFSACKNDEQNVLGSFEKYEVSFIERNLNNIPGKKVLFYHPHLDHDLILLNKSDYIPIELTLYDKCQHYLENIYLQNNIIYFRTSNVEKSIKLFQDLGFVYTDNKLLLKPVLDNKMIEIIVEYSKEEYNCMLDNYGFSSIAFWTNNIYKEYEKLKKMDYYVGEISEIVVNKKCLSIFFLQGKCGEIVEFIGVKKSENN